MADMQRPRFLGRDGGMGLNMPPMMGMPMPRGRVFAFPPIPPGPGPDAANDEGEVVRRTPEGVTRLRRFRGPNGNGFVWEFRSSTVNGKPVLPPPGPASPGPALPDDSADLRRRLPAGSTDRAAAVSQLDPPGRSPRADSIRLRACSIFESRSSTSAGVGLFADGARAPPCSAASSSPPDAGPWRA